MEEIKKVGTENEQAAPEENKEVTEAVEPQNKTEDDAAAIAEEREKVREKLREELARQRQIIEEANEVLRQGKGQLRLETPIKKGEKEYTELKYDFTVMKGFEYTDAMDSDANAANSFNLTKRQALALFAKAAAKQTDGLDMQDIVAEIGMTDSVEAVEIATLFFTASRRAGRMRISKL